MPNIYRNIRKEVNWMEDDNKEKSRQDDMLKAATAASSYETVQRFGDAAKQHYVAYSGVDNETGTTLVKGLKQIHDWKINPENEFRNIHQQAGFSAEVKDVARTNAEKIIRGDKTRKVRTDDIGRVNDPLYDAVTVDTKGNIIEGSGVQMKFLGASEKDPTGSGAAARALNKLCSKKFEKYLDHDVKIDVPSEQYEKIILEADSKIESLSEQLEALKEKGKAEKASEIQERIDKLKKIKRNLHKSQVSSEEAVSARLHPAMSTTSDIAKISHRAGIQTAESAALISGSFSIAKNLVSVCSGEIEPCDAISNVAKDTATAAVVGYGTGFAGTAVKGWMQNAKSQYVRTLSKTNIAGTIVAFSTSSAKTLRKYFCGEIDGVECLETLGEQGTGMVASAVFTMIGQKAISGSVIGSLIGGMIGYTISSAIYGILVESLKDAKLAKEQRIQIEAACNEHIKLIYEYRTNIERIVNEYLTESMDVFRESFSGMKDALATDDADWFIESANTIVESFGGEKMFTDMDDFNEKMLTGIPFKL